MSRLQEGAGSQAEATGSLKPPLYVLWPQLQVLSSRASVCLWVESGRGMRGLAAAEGRTSDWKHAAQPLHPLISRSAGLAVAQPGG